MKKIILAILVTVLITGCQPSEADIQKAIAETQTAQPTSTYTPIPPTSTVTPSPIPPTKTPTLAPTPRIFLRDYLVTIEDFALYGDYYNSYPFIIDEPFKTAEDFPLLSPSSLLQSTQAMFVPGDWADPRRVGEVGIILLQFTDSEIAQAQTRFMISELSPLDLSAHAGYHIENYYVSEDPDLGHLIGITTYNNYIAMIFIAKTPDIKSQEKTLHAVILLENQTARLRRIPN